MILLLAAFTALAQAPIKVPDWRLLNANAHSILILDARTYEKKGQQATAVVADVFWPTEGDYSVASHHLEVNCATGMSRIGDLRTIKLTSGRVTSELPGMLAWDKAGARQLDIMCNGLGDLEKIADLKTELDRRKLTAPRPPF